MSAYTSVKQWGSSAAKLIDGYLYAYDDFGNICHQVDHEGYVTACRLPL